MLKPRLDLTVQQQTGQRITCGTVDKCHLAEAGGTNIKEESMKVW
jgi:hypothetical protein